MMEQIQSYLILTAIFFLLFLVAAILFGQYKKSNHSFAKENFQRLKEVPFETVIKSLAAAGFILFFKKLLFYLSLTGIIQTKFSIWWVDKKTLIFLYYIFVLYLVGIAVIGLRKFSFKPGKSLVLYILLICLLYAGFNVIGLLLQETSIQVAKGLILIIFAPVILLKMLCPGKYLGLLTSFLLGYFIMAGYKKLSPQITKSNVKFLIAPVVVIILSMASSYFMFTGDWQERFREKLQSTEKPDAIVDLLDAAYTLPDVKDKSIALKKVAAVITSIGDSQWRKERFLQVVKVAGTIEDSKQRYHVLKEIAAAVVKIRDIKESKKLLQQSIKAIQTTSAQHEFMVFKAITRAIAEAGAGERYGDLFQQAIMAAKRIKDIKEKSIALNEMADLAGKTGNIKEGEQILQQAMDTADKITDKMERFDTLNEMTGENIKAGNIKWAKTIFQHAVRRANRVEDIKEKIDILTGIARVTARAGHSQWCHDLFQQVLDTAKKIEDNQKKSAAFAGIALGVTVIGNKKWGEQLFQQAMDAAKKIYDEYKRFHVFIQIAAGMLETGDIKPARDIIEQQLDEIYETWSDRALTKALLEILGAINKSKNIEWAEDIFLDAIDTVELMKGMTDNDRERLLMKIVKLIAEKGDIERFRDLYHRVIDAVGTIKSPFYQQLLYKEISLAIAKGGDIQWAESIAANIPDYKDYLKKSLLKEIREIREKIEEKGKR